jgi:flagellar motor switch protein FliN/FliY
MVNLLLASPRKRVGDQTESVIGPNSRNPAVTDRHSTSAGELASVWRAEAGHVTMSQGLSRLRIGGVLPLADSRLAGTPASPSGRVELILDLHNQDARFRMSARPVDDSRGRLVSLESSLLCEPRPRDAVTERRSEDIFMSQPLAAPNPPSAAPAASPLDVPVTLTVELGRVNLTLTRLADLKPGDVVELNRHSRAPVELTSNGRLVARGELILIDSDLGVRVTNVFL